MPVESHTLMDGKVHVYRRENSRFWQCAVFLLGRNHRQTPRQESLVLAMDFARDWYMERYADERLRRRGLPLPSAEERLAAGDPSHIRSRVATRAKGPTFRQAAEIFVAEYQIITHGERNPRYVKRKSEHLRLYLLPFFGDRLLTDISAGMIQEYRVHRLNPAPDAPAGVRSRGRPKAKPKRPARSTLHQELVTLRQVLKTANRKGWIAALPDMSAPYKASGKISHRAWFSPDEYKRLYEATRERARNPKNERWRGRTRKAPSAQRRGRTPLRLLRERPIQP